MLTNNVDIRVDTDEALVEIECGMSDMARVTPARAREIAIRLLQSAEVADQAAAVREATIRDMHKIANAPQVTPPKVLNKATGSSPAARTRTRTCTAPSR
jgi:hypothetical protein